MLTVINFIQRAVLQGTPLLYGATGEILTEKSGNLNLGIPGIMYIGAISGVVGGFMYQTSTDEVVPIIAVLIPFLCCLLGSLLVSLLYCFLTVTLRANQNVTGLAITTFGVGCGNFFGGSLIKIVKSDVPYLALVDIARAFKTTLPFAESMGALWCTLQVSLRLFPRYSLKERSRGLTFARWVKIPPQRTPQALMLRDISISPPA